MDNLSKKQLLQPRQIAGIYKENLYDEIIGLVEKVVRYINPVENIPSLHTTMNKDGDRCFVVDKDEFYIWDAKNKNWSEIHDKNIESISFNIPILSDNQKTFNIPYKLGIDRGIASFKSISVKVNGVYQNNIVDYVIKYNISSTNILYLNWVSSDFSLERTDVITVTADILTKI